MLDERAARAAIASGRPRLTAHAPTEAALEHVRAGIEAVLGPLPQADVVEPFDASDPHEPWELRVDVPGLDASRAAAVPPVRWSVADSPGLTDALDLGWLEAQRIEADGLVARWLVDPAGERRPDLVRREVPVDVPLARLGSVVGVVHRPTGRWGWEVTTDAAPERALSALAAVVRADGRLAPDPEWALAGGALVLRAWGMGPLAPGLPGEVAWDDPPVEVVADWIRDAAGLHEDLEVQLLLEAPADHDRAVAAVAPVAERMGWQGGRPRWVATRAGPVFAPTWRAAVVEPLALRGLPRVRVVPGEPVAAGEAWAVADPHWRAAGGRCFLRIADPIADRDWLPAEDRPADADDHALADALPYDVRPVVLPSGRPGLEVAGDRRTLVEEGLRTLLGAAGALRAPALASVGTFGFARDGARVRLAYRHDELALAAAGYSNPPR